MTTSTAFGNARYARTVFEKCLVRNAHRVSRSPEITDEMLTTIEDVDLDMPNVFG